MNCLKYSKSIILFYRNINSIRNKFGSVRALLNNYFDTSTAAEAKINESFPTAQFATDGFHKPLRLDPTDTSRGLFVYVSSYLPYVS